MKPFKVLNVIRTIQDTLGLPSIPCTVTDTGNTCALGLSDPRIQISTRLLLFPDNVIKVVLWHEAAHIAEKHLLKRLIVAGNICLALGFTILSLVIDATFTLPCVIWVLLSLAFFVQTVYIQEARADEFAVEMTSDANGLIRYLRNSEVHLDRWRVKRLIAKQKG